MLRMALQGLHKTVYLATVRARLFQDKLSLHERRLSRNSSRLRMLWPSILITIIFSRLGRLFFDIITGWKFEKPLLKTGKKL